jgi:hypothetical protein
MDINSITRVYLQDGQAIDLVLKMCKEYNGNPSSFGVDLCNFLIYLDGNFKDVGCLSAKIITHFKNKYDDISIKSNNINDTYDYLYDIYVDVNKKIKFCCYCMDRKLLYSGTTLGFYNYIIDYNVDEGRIPTEDDVIGEHK